MTINLTESTKAKVAALIRRLRVVAATRPEPKPDIHANISELETLTPERMERYDALKGTPKYGRDPKAGK